MLAAASIPELLPASLGDAEFPDPCWEWKRVRVTFSQCTTCHLLSSGFVGPFACPWTLLVSV